MSESFRINSPHVVAETLDAETTIVNLDTGTYYALNQSGSVVWEALAGGVAEDALGAALAAQFDVAADKAAEAAAGLVKQLREQLLIVPAEGEREPPGEPVSQNGSRGAFAEPVLSTYTDMQELLLLDPIHEVDESGWPNQP